MKSRCTFLNWSLFLTFNLPGGHEKFACASAKFIYAKLTHTQTHTHTVTRGKLKGIREKEEKRGNREERVRTSARTRVKWDLSPNWISQKGGLHP